MIRGQRITAARYLRLLASVENLAMLRMDDELRRAVDAVDPIEAREIADALDDENEQYVPTQRGLMAVWDETLAPRAEVIPLPGGYSMRVPGA